jgi:hypothetical protein
VSEGDTSQLPELSDADARAYRARREALQLAVHELDGHLDVLEAQDEPDRDLFRAALDELVVTLHRHVEEADAPDGLLAQILADASEFGSRVARLRGEHGDLLARADGLRERLAAGTGVEPLLADARELSARVAEHRRRGTELLLDATMLDLSAGD